MSLNEVLVSWGICISEDNRGDSKAGRTNLWIQYRRYLGQLGAKGHVPENSQHRFKGCSRKTVSTSLDYGFSHLWFFAHTLSSSCDIALCPPHFAYPTSPLGLSADVTSEGNKTAQLVVPTLLWLGLRDFSQSVTRPICLFVLSPFPKPRQAPLWVAETMASLAPHTTPSHVRAAFSTIAELYVLTHALQSRLGLSVDKSKMWILMLSSQYIPFSKRR
jgi:hypothetical protein